MKKLIILVLIISIILGIAYWLYGNRLLDESSANQNIDLKIWVFSEDEEAMKVIADAYQKAHPNIKFSFSSQSLLNYRTRLQTQLEESLGPDIFPIHSSWIGMMKTNLASVSKDVINISDFNNNYYPLFKNSLVSQNQVMALPFSLDGLAMYYNEDILKGAGITVPKTWAEFMEAAKKTTVPNLQGQIQTSGAALGTTTNVDFWPEILAMLLMQQPDIDINTPVGDKASEVLGFYTGFVTNPQTKTWDVNLPSSTQMFTTGKLAFYFAPASQITTIEISNPNLNFKVAPVPQLGDGKNITYGSFWAEAVSGSTKSQKEAWQFVKFLTSNEALQYIYEQKVSQKTPINLFPKVEMAGDLLEDPKYGAFLIQGPFYKTWYLNSGVKDGGINDDVSSIYDEAITSILKGTDTATALNKANVDLQVIWQKYNLAR